MSNQQNESNVIESSIISESENKSAEENRSRNSERIGKINNILHKYIVKDAEEDKFEEDQDWDEIIADDDLRYVIFCDKSASLLRDALASRIKPEFTSYKIYLEMVEMFKPYLFVLMMVFIFFGRPEWCSNMGPDINYACNRSLDPNNEVTYMRANLPILSSFIKLVICMICMTIITLINLFKVKITLGSNYHRNSFLFCLTLTFLYFINYLLHVFNSGQIPCADLMPIFFVIFNVDFVQKTVMKTIKIVWLTKETFYFYAVFALMMAVFTRVFFNREEEYYDDDSTPFYTFNYNTLGKSIYSGFLTAILSAGVGDGIERFFEEDKFICLFWVVLALFLKFLLDNFLIGGLCGFYDSITGEEVDFIETHPKFKKIMKEEIARERLDNDRLIELIKLYCAQQTFDTDILEIENFFLKSKIPSINSTQKGNIDSMSEFYINLSEKDNYKISMGSVEGFVVLLIIFTLDLEAHHLFIIYIFVFAFQFFFLFDQICYVSTRKYSSAQNIFYFDIIISGFILGCILICLLNQHPMYYVKYSEFNPSFKRYIGVFSVLKAFRFYQLLTYNIQIKVIIQAVFKSFAFISDILFVMGVIYFLYATAGISIYGGNINSGSPAVYEEIYGDELDEMMMIFNFNDYYHSFLLLFMIMMNGWHGFEKTNTLGMELTMWHNLFFASFFFFTGLIYIGVLFGNLVGSVDTYLSEKLDEENEKAAAKAEAGSAGGDGEGDDNDEDGRKDIEKSMFNVEMGPDMDYYIDLKKKDSVKNDELEDILEEDDNLSNPSFNIRGDGDNLNPLETVFNGIKNK